MLWHLAAGRLNGGAKASFQPLMDWNSISQAEVCEVVAVQKPKYLNRAAQTAQIGYRHFERNWAAALLTLKVSELDKTNETVAEAS